MDTVCFIRGVNVSYTVIHIYKYMFLTPVAFPDHVFKGWPS